MNSRQKGKRGEIELSRVLRGYGYDSHRGVQYKGGQDSPDVVGLPLIHIECKRVEQLNIYEAYAQSVRDAGILIPVVMHRRNNYRWLVTMGEGDFQKMTHSVQGICGYIVERKRLDVYTLLTKAKIHAREQGQTYYCLNHGKGDGSGFLVTMPLELWINLYRNWELDQNLPKEERG